MREVEVSRFIDAKHRVVERALGPSELIEHEGSFQVFDVDAGEDGTAVTAGARSLRMTLRFEERDDGWYYEQEGDAGPFDEMWTQVVVEPEDHGTRVTIRSGVRLGLPLEPISGRVGAWKRRGELKRALRSVAAELE